MHPERVKTFVDAAWEQDILPGLSEFVAIPNQSPLFDPEWVENGLLDRAAQHVARWCRRQKVEGLTVEILRAEDRTPCLCIEVAGATDETILFYGHIDKQPPGEGWMSGLGPYAPVVRDGRLYGRGAVDDGYAVFAALTAVTSVQAQGRPHARCIILVEASEESQSRDLPFYLHRLRDRLGQPSLVVVLDSVCGDYDRMWVTTSLRGSVVGILRVSLLREGVHSGSGSGVVASSFRVARHLLDRIEDSATGEILLPSLHAEIPARRRAEAEEVAQVLDVLAPCAWQPGARPIVDDPVELLINQAWRPALAVTGQAGIPTLEQGGNVIRPLTSLKLALRLPPTCNPDEAALAVKEVLEAEPPYGAQVSFDVLGKGAGWHAPEQASWLSVSLAAASAAYFGQPVGYLGVGGGIPLLNLLNHRFPEAQYLVTGVIGPNSNPHGPNESLHSSATKRLICCLAHVLTDHFDHR